MPVNRTYGVDAVLAACRAYPLSKQQVVFIEYVLIEGLNDSAADAAQPRRKAAGASRCRINLLPYNESPSLPYRALAGEQRQPFRDILRSSGFRTLVRNSRGADISAACGQLAERGPNPRSGAAHVGLRIRRQNRLAPPGPAC